MVSYSRTHRTVMRTYVYGKILNIMIRWACPQRVEQQLRRQGALWQRREPFLVAGSKSYVTISGISVENTCGQLSFIASKRLRIAFGVSLSIGLRVGWEQAAVFWGERGERRRTEACAIWTAWLVLVFLLFSFVVKYFGGSNFDFLRHGKLTGWTKNCLIQRYLEPWRAKNCTFSITCYS